MRDELLNGKIFYKLIEAQVIIEHWRKHYNTKRPHRSLGSLCFSLRIWFYPLKIFANAVVAFFRASSTDMYGHLPYKRIDFRALFRIKIFVFETRSCSCFCSRLYFPVSEE